ncbi:MAG: nuclear transport factor 2 family protein [Candidatus Binatia bacterium]
MPSIRHLVLAATLLAGSLPLQAHEPVVVAADADALFHSRDPHLDRNKQAAYHIIRDLIDSGHWEMADQFLTERYIQHNPMADTGRAAAVKFFTEVLQAKPEPIPAKLVKSKVVAVVAEGDFVTVTYVRELKDPKDPAKTYTTSWFDMWRFVDGKADEHWDPMTRM